MANGGKAKRNGKAGMKLALSRYFSSHPGHKRDKMRQAKTKRPGNRRKTEQMWSENFISLGSLG